MAPDVVGYSVALLCQWFSLRVW